MNTMAAAQTAERTKWMEVVATIVDTTTIIAGYATTARQRTPPMTDDLIKQMAGKARL